MALTVSVSAVACLFGIVIGSFLNVLILRIPQKEEFVRTPSHCMACGHRLKWYDLFPLFSWIFLRGKCRYCKQPISKQYPLVEGANGIVWFGVFCFSLWGAETNPDALLQAVLWSLMCSALLALSVIDWRTYEIPLGFNIFILLLGGVWLGTHISDWLNYVIGLCCVSGVLLLIYLVSKGRAIGGGDVKLMAACGFLIGWQKICFAFIAGCILGALIHSIRMKKSGADHVLAMGPYLSLGVLLSLFLCEPFLAWYMSFLP